MKKLSWLPFICLSERRTKSIEKYIYHAVNSYSNIAALWEYSQSCQNGGFKSLNPALSIWTQAPV